MASHIHPPHGQTPHFHIWNGWDAVAVLWLVAGLAILAFLPTVVTNYSGQERAILLTLVVAAGPFFLFAAFGRRLQHVSHEQQEHPRPYDAPD